MDQVGKRNKQALTLADELRSLHKDLVDGDRVHGGLGFTGRNLDLLQTVERFLILNAVDDHRFEQAYEQASRFQIMKCTRGGSTRQDVAIHELALLAPLLERLSNEKPTAHSEAGSQPASVSAADTPGNAQGGSARQPRFSSQIKSMDAASRVRNYLEEQKRRTGLTMKAFAALAGTTYKTLAKFLNTGCLRRSILVGVAEAMGLTLEQILAEDGEQRK